MDVNSEQEILRKLECAKRRAEERKNKRAKSIYVVCFIIVFLVMNFVMDAGLIESVLASVFGGGILMYIFLVAFSGKMLTFLNQLHIIIATNLMTG